MAGYSLRPQNKFDNFYLLKLDKIKNYYGDVKDKETINKIKIFRPDIIFHLAAQPLVKEDLIKIQNYTISTNIIGNIKCFRNNK